MFNNLSALAPVIQLGRRLVAPVTDALEAPKKIAKLEQDLEIARYKQSLDQCLLDVTTEVYRDLGLDWDPATLGTIADEVTGVDADDVAAAETALALAAIDAPSVPPAPPLLSITRGLPVSLVNCAPSGRANASVPPPAGNGTSSVTGLAGHACAQPALGRAKAAAASTWRRLREGFMGSIRLSVRLKALNLATFETPPALGVSPAPYESGVPCHDAIGPWHETR